MADALVTIITVVYNDIKNIEKTIQAILNQNYQSIEYVIIDGGSSDGTIDIIKQYDKNISYWVSEKDAGIYNAMNKGVKHSNGEWLIFMNSGDLFYDNDVLKKIFYKANYSSVAILYGNTLAKNSKSVSKPPDAISKNFFYLNTICHQSVFFNKNVFKSFGNYNLGYKIIADRELLYRVARSKGKFLHADHLVSIWDEEGFSKANISLFQREEILFQKENFLMAERHFILFKKRLQNLLKKLIKVRIN
ncbi:glycosyltransferase family 2 protein [Flavobacterium sp. TAB 87]|uniref:glycosyltransferase family 2 protein n=1 Tax=Flavobacterium sp. TAB 87 TaxID=1729581 RepID=UPI00076D8484|nr:glycosyltransferase family 2 protein [Flavobacterium sp. TAB 87]KVV13968.1 PGL/p-HBAD biosynthesis glycosyltransferase/MT3031 [Flavobacterium sp. TAB 87]